MKIVEVLLAARSITTDYQSQFNHDSPIRIFKDGIQEIVAKQTDHQIQITCLDWPGNMFAARLDRYNDVSKIWYSSTLNTCWSRFFIAKELAHIICGNEQNYTKSLLPLVDSIIHGIPLTEEMEDCMLEHQAFYGAIELLLPEHLYDDLYTQANAKTNRELAEHFRVPENIIDYRLSEPARKMFNEFKSDVK
ncbi:MAG: hypothetical protein A6F71_06640 [Cycloclasticus sp. symbiont of Poecilosclerida sp. M]|nr:MAG: hypothetical protein A6F71_06640 [Cycloclasticus sp. symbiont of Poecilosclerida sp. M]